MHPGVVVSGLSSLFRPTADSAGPTPAVPVDSGSGAYPLSPANSISDSRRSSYATSSYAPSSGSTGYFEPNSGRESTYSLTNVSTATDDQQTSPFASPTPSTPQFNPPFPNDVNRPVRTGWNNALHFVTKHSDGLIKASKQYVVSHLEFGGCLADYKGLKARYAKIRALEDVSTDQHSQDVGVTGNSHSQKPRVRFVNYYTASTGRPKGAKSPMPQSREAFPRQPIELEMQHMSLAGKRRETPSPSPSPRISVEEHRGDEIITHHVASGSEEFLHVDPTPISDSESFHRLSPAPASDTDLPSHNTSEEIRHTDSLPPIPPFPAPPLPFNSSEYSSKDALKLAEKQHVRDTKAHKRAVKDRERAIKDRQKMFAKQEKQRERQLKLEEKQRLREEQHEQQQQQEEKEKKREQELNRVSSTTSELGPNSTPTRPPPPPPPAVGAGASNNHPPFPSTIPYQENQNPHHHHHQQQLEHARGAAPPPPPPPNKPRDKKFCMLPPKDRSTGDRDPTWVRVYMEGVDEVGAHCGLFFAGEVYQRLVGDVGSRIEDWVREKGGGRGRGRGEGLTRERERERERGRSSVGI
ncbi:MAG: hypothetical protein M1837_003803 [Sclerophora amabilis]|nr:MAG: hypothetical protein M1837_003803 [Sclerophora amabilis]